MRIIYYIYYNTEHTKALVQKFFKELLTLKFVDISIGKFPAYKESNCYANCMP